MDGFETARGVIVMAATNRPEILDPALLRPGRFDRQIMVDLPDRQGRLEILEIHSRTVTLRGECQPGGHCPDDAWLFGGRPG